MGAPTNFRGAPVSHVGRSDRIPRNFTRFDPSATGWRPSTLFAASGGVLRIELLDRKNGNTTLELAGRVIGPWVDELSRSCERVLAIGGTLSVDLGQVSFVDRDGVQFLQRLRARDVALVNCSPFVAEQLKGQ